MKNKLLFLLLLVSYISHAQQRQFVNDYGQLSILKFFVPDGNSNKSSYVHIDEKGNKLVKMTWNRYFLNDNKANNQHLLQIVDEQMYDSQITYSSIKYLLVDDKSIRILKENRLAGILSDGQTPSSKSYTLLVIPESEKIATKWQRIDEDGAVITSVADFMDYQVENKSLPCIRVKETTILSKANINITKEYYYIYGLGYIGSAILNKGLNKLVLFEKMDALTHDERFDDKKDENSGSKSDGSLSSEATTMPVIDDNKIFTKVEQQPEFSGGMAALSQYLSKNLRYPAAAQRANISGRVFVNFVVNADGSLQDIKVVKGLGYGTDEEAIRVVSNMPKWRPGKQSGRPVRVRYNLPINFTLE